MSSTHANPLGTKTDAPFAVIWDIMRAWVKDHPVKAMVRGFAAFAVRPPRAVSLQHLPHKTELSAYFCLSLDAN